jgi:hypothetical protein
MSLTRADIRSTLTTYIYIVLDKYEMFAPGRIVEVHWCAVVALVYKGLVT